MQNPAGSTSKTEKSKECLRIERGGVVDQTLNSFNYGANHRTERDVNYIKSKDLVWDSQSYIQYWGSSADDVKRAAGCPAPPWHRKQHQVSLPASIYKYKPRPPCLGLFLGRLLLSLQLMTFVIQCKQIRIPHSLALQWRLLQLPQRRFWSIQLCGTVSWLARAIAYNLHATYK